MACSGAAVLLSDHGTECREVEGMPKLFLVALALRAAGAVQNAYGSKRFAHNSKRGPNLVCVRKGADMRSIYHLLYPQMGSVSHRRRHTG